MQTENAVLKLNINLLIPNKYQPRKEFDEEEIQNLIEIAELEKDYTLIFPQLIMNIFGRKL